MESNKRCVLYVWTWDDEPDEVESRRLAKCRAVARTLGLAIVDEYADTFDLKGISRQTNGLEAALASVQAGETDVVIVVADRDVLFDWIQTQVLAVRVAALGGSVIACQVGSFDCATTAQAPRINTTIGKQSEKGVVDGVVPNMAPTCPGGHNVATH